MSFFSTRGGACVTASQAILWGLAKDGGLYVPSMFPQLSSERMASLCGASYQEQAARILRDYLEDYTMPRSSSRSTQPMTTSILTTPPSRRCIP